MSFAALSLALAPAQEADSLCLVCLECNDCGAPNPQWCSLGFGTFICLECSGVHRSMGTHLTVRPPRPSARIRRQHLTDPPFAFSRLPVCPKRYDG